MNGQFQLTPTGGQEKNGVADIILVFAGISAALGVLQRMPAMADYSLGAAAALPIEHALGVLPLLAYAAALRLLRLRTTQRYEATPAAGPEAALRDGALHFPARAGLERIVCPACGREQRADRALCEICGLDFVFDGEEAGAWP